MVEDADSFNWFDLGQLGIAVFVLLSVLAYVAKVLLPRMFAAMDEQAKEGKAALASVVTTFQQETAFQRAETKELRATFERSIQSLTEAIRKG
jgi:hypothetical protein